MNENRIQLYPELIEDVILYILIAVLLCLAAKLIHDRKEKRRLKKECEAYQQKKEDEEG